MQFPYRQPTPGEMGEPRPNFRPRAPREPRPRFGGEAPQAQYRSFAPEEVAQRRAQFAKRQQEYARSNTLSSPFRPTAPSGNQFV